MAEGVTLHEPEKCEEGYTLFCEAYEDPTNAPDGTGKIHLVDMAGESVHEWQVETAVQSYAELEPDGTLVYPTRDRSTIAEAGIRKLTPESEVVWSYHCRADHDFERLEDGNLLIHTVTDGLAPEIGPELKRNPYVLEVTPEKKVVWEWHGENHYGDLKAQLSDEEWEYVRNRIDEEYPFDWAHNNTCQVIPPNETHEREQADEREGEDPRFAPGNLTVSYRSLDVIGVIERGSGEIVWAWGPDELDGQHNPHVLANGNVLLFDNGTRRGYSRVIELDPLTEEIVWEYTATPKESFFSPYISGAQRLPNGNTLIREGMEAHLFEVTPDGEVVWDFVNPFADEGSVGFVYQCRRYAPEYVEPLLEP